MTSTYSTVTNFSLKDFITKLTRIEILNFIQNDLKITAESYPENNLLFPRERNPSRNYVNINEKISPKIFEKQILTWKQGRAQNKLNKRTQLKKLILGEL